MGARILKFEVIHFMGARVIGKSVKVKVETTLDDPTINDLLDKINYDRHYEFLFGLNDKLTSNKDTVGWQGDYNFGDSEYTYIAGVLFKSGTEVPDGYEYRDIDECNMVIVLIQETIDDKGDVFADASALLSKVRDDNGYQYDDSHGLFEMEYYSEERFYNLKNRDEKIILDFYSPCKKVI